ncbi:unnamed protein product [Symbiodinium sp. CCMP2592]|nr:unnamed protein product [Symbiodinium sp. CCMP2592]
MPPTFHGYLQHGLAEVSGAASILLLDFGPSDKKARPNPDEEEYEEPAKATPPPMQVTKATLMKRLARICTPKADGTYKVPMEIINTHKNLETRDEVYRAFEKCGCDPAQLRVNRKYEEINEKSVETEYEFLAEQEMEDKGWSEKKIKGAKKSCERRPGYKRKSEYCDEWMYWVAVKVKGSNKKTKRNTVAEILEGGDNEPMEDPDEAMQDFPFALEGDGEAAKEEGDGEKSSDDSSDDGEEAARVLKKISFPELTKKPQDCCSLVSACLQKRVMRIEPIVLKLGEIKDANKAHQKYKASLESMITRVNELDDKMMALYSQGVAAGFTKVDQKSLRTFFQEAKRVQLGSSEDEPGHDGRVQLYAEMCLKEMANPGLPESEKREVSNAERDCHAKFNRMGLSLPVPIQTHDHCVENEEIISTSYVLVSSWLRYLVRQMPCLLAGGRNTLEVQLEAFWKMYQNHHPEHAIFSAEHITPATAIPLCLFSDEGKGPKRGNYLMTCMESPIGLSEMPEDFACSCSSHVSHTPSQFVPGCDTVTEMCDAAKEAAKQTTNLQGASFLTRHYLFGLPDWVYKHHDSVLQKMMELVAEDMSKLFTQGAMIAGKRYFAILTGLKGDFKHMAEKYGELTRSYSHLGKVNYLGMCSHCLAGTRPDLPWDQATHDPAWAGSEFASRPWDEPPVFCSIPFDSAKPEAALKLDAFHLFKVGLGRDLVGTMVLFARLGFYDFSPGESTELKQRLNRAWKHFMLWRVTAKQTVACKYFSPALFNIKRQSDYAWANVKGSDTMVFMRYIRWYAGLLVATRTLHDPHRRLLVLLNKTIMHAQQAMHIMYTHGLWLARKCGQSLYVHLMSMLSGYQTLAARCLTMDLTFYGLKPKFHGLHHLAYDLKKALKTSTPLVLNPICWGNEMNEDAIGTKQEGSVSKSGLGFWGDFQANRAMVPLQNQLGLA